MDIEEAKSKLTHLTTMTLPGYAQLLPRAQAHFQYNMEQILIELVESELKKRKVLPNKWSAV